MDFAEVVARRRMVRRYRGEPVAEAALDRMLDLARRGPSAGYTQGTRFVVVTDAARRLEMARLCGEPEHVARGRAPWLSVAPVHIVVCVREDDYRERYAEADKAPASGPDHWSAPYWWVDGGAALMLLLLAAVDEGLGAGVLDLADPDGVRALLGIPADVSAMCLVTLGHPAADQPHGSPATRPRRDVADVVRRERW